MSAPMRRSASIWSSVLLAACGGASREPMVEPAPFEVATVVAVSDVADASPPRVRANESTPIMLAMMPSDVACSYANPASRKITLRASSADGANLVTVGPTGMASRLVITGKGHQFVELTGLRLRARGYPATDELVASRDIAFGELLVIPRAENVRPAAVSRGKLVIDAPVVEGLRFLSPPAPAEVPCDALTLDDVVFETGAAATIGSVQLGRKPRELYATPGGPAIAVTVPPADAQAKPREVAVIGKQRGFLHVLVNDGRARVVAWVKDTGLNVVPLAQMLDSIRMDMLAQLGSANMVMGVQSSGVGAAQSDPATEVLRKNVHCKEPITLLASRIVGGPRRVPILVLKDVDLRCGEPRGDYVTVDVMSPRDIAPEPGATLEARAADIESCTAE